MPTLQDIQMLDYDKGHWFKRYTYYLYVGDISCETTGLVLI